MGILQRFTDERSSLYRGWGISAICIGLWQESLCLEAWEIVLVSPNGSRHCYDLPEVQNLIEVQKIAEKKIEILESLHSRQKFRTWEDYG